MNEKHKKIYDDNLSKANKKKFRRNQIQFERDCRTFSELIKDGKELETKAPSVGGFSLEKVKETEKAGFKWFIKTRNFLIDLFGENFRDIKTFEKCFHGYEARNLLGMYQGEIIFVEEDLNRAIGVLEGIYNSFVNGEIKRRNEVMIHLSKIYHEIKDWFAIISRGIK